MKYRKRPVVIEAFRFLHDPVPTWFENSERENQVRILTPDGYPSYVEVKTLEGTMRGNIGDWIIKGVNGELYPCKHDIFEKTYEAVTE